MKDDQYILSIASQPHVQRIIDNSSKLLQGYKSSQLVQFVESCTITQTPLQEFGQGKFSNEYSISFQRSCTITHTPFHH